VGGEQDGHPLALRQSADLLPHRGPDLRVQPGRGLVEEEDAGPVDEAHGDAQPALHPARVALRDAVGGLGEAEPPEQLIDPWIEMLAAQSVELALKLQVLPAGGLFVDAGLLSDDADRLADPLGLVEDAEAADSRRARVRVREGREDLDRGGLTGAVRSEQPEDRAGRDADAEPVECLRLRGIGLLQADRLDLDGGQPGGL
jgi:hypothetical protein